MSRRLQAMGKHKYRNNFKLTLHPDSIADPYHWKKPTVVFVNSMSDLFHRDVPLDFIKKVFKTMNDNPRHTFQVLTKRSDILLQHDSELVWSSNIWMGVSVEDNRVQHRIDHLRQTNALIKFLSIEPLIGPLPELNLQGIDWVIAGGESGPGARPMNPEWVRSIRDQCRAAGTKFLFKQWGSYAPDESMDKLGVQFPTNMLKLGKKKAGRLLDGVEHNEFPV